MYRSLTLACLVFQLFFALTSGLQLEVPAKKNPEPLCIRDFTQKQQLVVLNIKSEGHYGDGQQLNLKVTDSLGNVLRVKDDIQGLQRVAFTNHNSVAFDVCFTNQLSSEWTRAGYVYREVDLEVESGAVARNWNAIQVSEQLRPVEVDLLKVKEATQEIVSELQYLKRREERMRDTNESTNSRVKWFSILIVGSLVGLGAWQIQYLRHYFKIKHII